jgi:hypothetical protein
MQVPIAICPYLRTIKTPNIRITTTEKRIDICITLSNLSDLIYSIAIPQRPLKP